MKWRVANTLCLFMILLVIAALSAVAVNLCFDCFEFEWPDPNGGPPNDCAVCLEDAGSGTWCGDNGCDGSCIVWFPGHCTP